MKYLKEVGLIILGALVMYVVLTGVSLATRVKFVEVRVGQIINALNRPVQQPVQPQVETPKRRR